MARFYRIVIFLFCIGLITLFLGFAATQNSENTGDYIDDSVIANEIKDKIFDKPSLQVFQINVETSKGVVQVSGFVLSEQKVRKTEEVTLSLNI